MKPQQVESQQTEPKDESQQVPTPPNQKDAEAVLKKAGDIIRQGNRLPKKRGGRAASQREIEEGMMPAKRKSAEIQKRLALQEAAVTWAMEGLNTAEAKAMRVLMKGSSVTYAAMVAGVARSTLYDWLEPGRPLAAALDKWKRDLANTARTRLLTFCDLATHNVRDALRNGDTRTALRVLEKLGILDTPPVGPSDSDMRAEEEFHETEQTQRDARYTQLMEKIISLPSPAAEPVRKELTSEKNSA